MHAVREPLIPLNTARWHTYLAGAGALEQTEDSLRLVNVDTMCGQMTNAQIDDYVGLPRRRLLWRPPLRLTVRARFSHPISSLSGTAGFGFWNDPFLMTGGRWPVLPSAIWFFYASPPSDLKLDLNAPGRGWKAATLDATHPAALAWVPLAPVVVPLMSVQTLYRRLWPRIQRALGICEAAIDVEIRDWHTYVLHWVEGSARFEVDGVPVLDAPASPRGPLGFVMWLDNQVMVITPWGRFRYGTLDAPGRQWMEVDTLTIEPSAG